MGDYDSLVERVGDAINEAPGTIDDLDNMARSAIREVATWLREYRGDEVTAKILEGEIADV